MLATDLPAHDQIRPQARLGREDQRYRVRPSVGLGLGRLPSTTAASMQVGEAK